jgi:hypothetical protein
MTADGTPEVSTNKIIPTKTAIYKDKCIEAEDVTLRVVSSGLPSR